MDIVRQRAEERRRIAAQPKPRKVKPPGKNATCVALLLAEDPTASGLAPKTLAYRARYRFDDEFRCREILRRQARDYHMPSDGTLTPRAVQRLFAEATHCAYCRLPMHARTKTLDHIVPRSKGGWHSLSNVTVCCLSCNSRKHDRDLNTWMHEMDANLKAS